MKSLSQQESNILYVIKSFAILCVVTAHMPFGNAYPVAEIVRMSLSQIGVIIFFISSGFFYTRKKNDSRQFYKKKAKTVLIPWVIWSLFVYLILVLITRSLSGFPLSYLKVFFGIGHVYWYLTILFICYVIFRYIYAKDEFLYICMAITIGSVLLSAFGVIKYSYLNQYLNVFNWVGFFALGILIRRKNLLLKITKIPFFIVAFALLIIFIVLSVIRGSQIEAYIDILSIPIELCGFISCLFFSKLLSSIKVLIDLGKKSFPIYLMHIIVAGAINTRLPYNTVFFILRPFIALAVCYIISKTLEYVMKKLKLSEYNYIFGLGR